MKRLVFLFALIITSVCHAQSDLLGDKLYIKKFLSLKGKEISGIRTDTNFNSNNELPSAKAVADFVKAKVVPLNLQGPLYPVNDTTAGLDTTSAAGVATRYQLSQIGAAVTPSLQQVTTVGRTTSDSIVLRKISGVVGGSIQLQPGASDIGAAINVFNYNNSNSLRVEPLRITSIRGEYTKSIIFDSDDSPTPANTVLNLPNGVNGFIPFSIDGHSANATGDIDLQTFKNVSFGITSYTGQVGINTNAPTADLDVIGTVKATSFTGDGSALTGVSASVTSSSITSALGYTPLSTSDASTTYSPLGHTHTFTSITSRPTTLSGYGITDALPASNPTATGVLTSPSVNVSGTAGSGFINLTGQSSVPSAPSSTNLRLYSDASGRLSWINNLGYSRTFRSNSLTASRLYTLPDKDMTIADSADVASKANAANPSISGLLTIAATTQTGSGTTGAMDISQIWNTSGIVNGINLNVTNTSSNSSSSLLTLQANSNNMFRVNASTAAVIVGSNSSNIGIGPAAISGGSADATGSGLRYVAGAAGTGGAYAHWFVNVLNKTATTGTGGFVRMTETFAPTSGSAEYNMLTLLPTVNQTGGASGVARGLLINATLTASADFRAIEFTNATGRGIWGAGASASALAGTLKVGNASVTASNVTLEAVGTSSVSLLNRGTKTQRDAISSPPTGALYYVTDAGGYLSWYNGTGWFKVTSTAD